FSSGWSESVWQDVDATRGAPVFIVDVTRHPSVPREQRTWREPRSIWNQAWFSTQRCANGLLRHARHVGSSDLEARARKMTAIARDGRWEDFETYYSCAPWGVPGERVARNGVYKQNTLSIAWCAEAFLRAGMRRAARRCLDELSLYQAVWDPPFLPAPAHGGF